MHTNVIVCTYRHKDVFNINIRLNCEIFSVHFIVLLGKICIEHFIIRDISLLHLDQCINAKIVPVRISRPTEFANREGEVTHLMVLRSI